MDLTRAPIECQLTGLASAWQGAYGVSASGEEGVNPLVVEAECWLGSESAGPGPGSSKVVKKYSGNPMTIATSIGDRSGVDNTTYSCAYGFYQKINDLNKLPSNAKLFNTDCSIDTIANCIGDTSEGHIIEGANDAGNLDASDTGGTLEGPPETETSSGGGKGWGFFPSGTRCSENRNPIGGLLNC